MNGPDIGCPDFVHLVLAPFLMQAPLKSLLEFPCSKVGECRCHNTRRIRTILNRLGDFLDEGVCLAGTGAGTDIFYGRTHSETSQPIRAR